VEPDGIEAHYFKRRFDFPAFKNNLATK